MLCECLYLHKNDNKNINIIIANSENFSLYMYTVPQPIYTYIFIHLTHYEINNNICFYTKYIFLFFIIIYCSYIDVYNFLLLILLYT